MTRNPRSERTARGFRPRLDCAYIAFNKPYGVLTQFTGAGSDKRTLSEFGFPPGVYPVGRLDYDSEGLLILTDDGRLNALLLHPARGHQRTYLAHVENTPDERALERLRQGVVVQNERTLPALAELLADEPDLPPRPVPIRFRRNIPTAWIRLTLTEGRNRQVRRMTACVGCPTLRLVRVEIGRLSLFDLALAPGQWKLLDSAEVAALLQTGSSLSR
ncbi:MAG TPA: pseudouridine synthase [Candidatus Obscuribacterales bacterium]